jgi:hypothetical protein
MHAPCHNLRNVNGVISTLACFPFSIAC